MKNYREASEHSFGVYYCSAFSSNCPKCRYDSFWESSYSWRVGGGLKESLRRTWSHGNEYIHKNTDKSD